MSAIRLAEKSEMLLCFYFTIWILQFKAQSVPLNCWHYSIYNKSLLEQKKVLYNKKIMALCKKQSVFKYICEKTPENILVEKKKSMRENETETIFVVPTN